MRSYPLIRYSGRVSDRSGADSADDDGTVGKRALSVKLERETPPRSPRRDEQLCLSILFKRMCEDGRKEGKGLQTAGSPIGDAMWSRGATCDARDELSRLI